MHYYKRKMRSKTFFRYVTLFGIAAVFLLFRFCAVYFGEVRSDLHVMKFSSTVLNTNISCYRNKNISTLPNLLNVSPAENKSIFFLETSCKSSENGKIIITPRQACSVEAAARANGNFEVHLSFTSPGIYVDELSESDRVLGALLSYENIKLSHVDYKEMLKGTPVEELYSSGQLEGSRYSLTHASDILRIVLLWRYGGIYLDLDIMTLKSLESVALNSVAAESIESLNGAFMRIDSQGVGHQLAFEMLEELRDSYQEYSWGYNGPGLVSKVFVWWCNASSIEELLSSECPEGLKVYPPRAFYPIPYWNWGMFFDADQNEAVLEQISDSYAIHFSNALTGDMIVDVDSNVPYKNLAEKFCPKVFLECYKTF